MEHETSPSTPELSSWTELPQVDDDLSIDSFAAPHGLDPMILRESDIRGIVGENLDVRDAYAIGRSFGTIIRACGGSCAAVGWDGRLTSPELAASLSAGLSESGVDVYQIGCGPSPMLYFAAHAMETHGAIMVTGSHNPAQYNGFKLMLGHASFHGKDIKRLGAIAARGEYASGNGEISDSPLVEAYLERLLEEAHGLGPLRVAWDPGNGAAGEIVTRLTQAMPGTHFVINGEIDGTFPAHHPDPTIPENLVQLIRLVRKNKCDLGIGLDGDGDRIGVVDSEGNILWGDQLMMLFSADVLKDSPGATIIADVKSSQALFDRVAHLGGNPVMWKTGHSLIKSKMVETNAPLAGEMSGHIFFADRYYGYDDAVYAALRLLHLVSASSGGLASLLEDIPVMFNTPELRLGCHDRKKWQIVGDIRKRMMTPGSKVNDLDGVRVSTPDGWWLLRASNTQAVLVARCESDSPEGLDRLQGALKKQLALSCISSDLI